MSVLQHYCDGCNKPEGRGEHLALCVLCGTMEYCSKACQRKHWKFHKPGHNKAIAEAAEKKRVAAEEAVVFPKESFIQHVNASWDDNPEVRGLLIDILNAYTERRLEGLLIYTKGTEGIARHGRYYPLRFIGNGDRPHSEVDCYTAKEVPAIEVEHCMSLELEKMAKRFLYGMSYETIELNPQLYFQFCSQVMNRGFWLRVDGNKQYDLRARSGLSRGHIAPVSWDGEKQVFNSAGQLRGMGANVFDKSKVEPRFLQDAEDGMRFSQETIDANARMKERLAQQGATVTPEKPG